MIVDYRLDLEFALSSDRLSAYRPAGGDDLAMVTTYFWNVALCQALYPSLGALEVAMRNGIHSALLHHHARDDWYDLPNLLQARERDAIHRAKRQIRAAGRPTTPGRVVAALRFGFWTSMLSAIYGNSPNGPQLWVSPNSPLLAAAFPYAPASTQPFRSRIHRRFDELRHVRNRISHYEPIWGGVRLPSGRRGVPGPLTQLVDVHANIIDAIGWISPTLRDSIALFDRFPTVYQNERQQIQDKLEDWLASA